MASDVTGISLEMTEFVHRLVEKGTFSSEQQVVEAALRMMADRFDQSGEDASAASGPKIAALIEEGMRDVRDGRVVVLDSEEDIHRFMGDLIARIEK